MGYNVDCEYLFKAPEKIPCPRCGNVGKTGFEEVDIDCGDPINGDTWTIGAASCEVCGMEFKYQFKVTVTDRKVIPLGQMPDREHKEEQE